MPFIYIRKKKDASVEMDFMPLQAVAQCNNNESDEENWSDLENDNIAGKLCFIVFVGAYTVSSS